MKLNSLNICDLLYNVLNMKYLNLNRIYLLKK